MDFPVTFSATCQRAGEKQNSVLMGEIERLAHHIEKARRLTVQIEDARRRRAAAIAVAAQVKAASREVVSRARLLMAQCITAKVISAARSRVAVLSPDVRTSGSIRRRDSGQLRVVVVDDDPDTVMTLVALLRDEGYATEGFANSKVALDAIPKVNPDVLILDIAMPALNGWDFAKEVRKRPGPQPRMIAISGQYKQAAHRSAAQKAGFSDYLVKPCDPQVLMTLVAKGCPS